MAYQRSNNITTISIGHHADRLHPTSITPWSLLLKDSILAHSAILLKTRPTMACFNDLPIENVMMIADALVAHRDTSVNDTERWNNELAFANMARQSALAALALTSKGLNAIATPRLYRRPVPYAKDWTLLARTLIERPDLAQHIRELYLLDMVEVADMETYPGGDIVSPAYEALVQQRSEGAFKEEEDDEEEDDEEELDEEDAVRHDVLDLFTALCPRLTRIEAFVDCLGRAFTFSGPGSLPDLTDIHMHYAGDEGGWGLSAIRNLARAAPNLSTMTCGNVNRGFGPRCTFGNVTKLRLTNSRFEPGDFEPIIQALPRLDTLDFVVGGAFVLEREIDTPREMQDVLLRNAPNLRFFAILLWDAGEDFGPEDRWTSFAPLTTLEHLELDYSCLPEDDEAAEAPAGGRPEYALRATAFTDLLPRSIKSLVYEHDCFDQPPNRLTSALEHLAAEAAVRFPSLHRVTIRGTRLGDTSEIRALLERRGIEYVLEEGR